jgi:hypothetical protein
MKQTATLGARSFRPPRYFMQQDCSIPLMRPSRSNIGPVRSCVGRDSHLRRAQHRRRQDEDAELAYLLHRIYLFKCSECYTSRPFANALDSSVARFVRGRRKAAPRFQVYGRLVASRTAAPIPRHQIR